MTQAPTAVPTESADPPHIALRAYPESAALARRFAVGVVAGHPFDPYEVALVVSELVTNALRHARAHSGDVLPIRLEVAIHDGHARVSVTDRDSTPIPERPSRVPDECGRGLAIVDAHTSARTITYGTSGKTVTVWLPARGDTVTGYPAQRA